MFTINDNRIDHSPNAAPTSGPTKDMTQRVRIDGNTAQSNSAKTAAPQRHRSKKRWYMTKKEKITLISLASVTAVLLIAAIILFSTMFAAPADDGKILKGVMAAGVNIGGMTPSEAAAALEKATADTYTKLDMVVTVLDTQITLSPQNTGAHLDIAAVVEDAYHAVHTAKQDGFSVVGVYDSHESRQQELALLCDVFLPDYLDLTDFWKFASAE